MKINISNGDDWGRFEVNWFNYTQEQYDYVFKCLDFDKLKLSFFRIHFNNEEIRKVFKENYVFDFGNDTINQEIYKNNKEINQWLKDNWCKNSFKLGIAYLDKQELKTVVNKIINVELIRGK